MNNQRAYLTGVFLVIVCLAPSSQALARPPYLVAFNKHYKHIPEMYDESIKLGRALCAICHLPEDKDHKKLNDYGAAFGARMTRADYYRLVKEAKEAKEAKYMEAVHKKAHETFEKVEYDKSPSGELYGDRIHKGVLPASSK